MKQLIDQRESEFLDRVVEAVAPRSWAGFFVKLVLAQTLLVGLYLLKEVLLGLRLADLTFPDIRPVFVLGVPFIWFALSIMWHQRKLHERLAALAVTDVLTGLLNRRGFMQAVSDDDVFLRDGILVLLDVDHFKRINDSLGHTVGDQCLVAVARRLNSLSRIEDHVARHGGEEFVMFLSGAEAADLQNIRDRLTMTIPVRLRQAANIDVSMSLSAGAVKVKEGEAVAEKMFEVDRAMYDAKEAGRSRLVLVGAAAS